MELLPIIIIISLLPVIRILMIIYILMKKEIDGLLKTKMLIKIQNVVIFMMIQISLLILIAKVIAELLKNLVLVV